MGAAAARRHIREGIVGYLALFALLVTGTAKAVDGPLAGQNTVGSEDIIGNEVKSDDIGNGRIFNLDIADDVIQSGKIKDRTLLSEDVGANTLGTNHIAESTLFNDNSLGTGDVDEQTLFNDGSLTQTDLATGSVGPSELQANSVNSSDVANESLGPGNVGFGQVGSAEIQADSVRSSELGPISVTTVSDSLAAGESAALTANCPTGFTGVGGDAGWFFGGSDGQRLLGSYPSGASQLSGWTGRFKNDEGGPSTAEVSAYCLFDPFQ